MGLLALPRTAFSHPAFSLPAISLGLTALTLLLSVLVLLSVPGPIKGLYWFSVKGEEGGPMNAGVLGWCMTDTSNCTYAPLSENAYLSGMINTGEALVVRTMLPLACYWMIVTFLLWIGLTLLTPVGYTIKDLDSIARHLRFAIVESCVLCMSIFGNVLCWLAFGTGRNAYLSVVNGGGDPKSGRAMETTAVAAVMSLLSLFTAIWGLHLRLNDAQAKWKDEAVMVRRRSMALYANGNPATVDVENLGKTQGRDEDKQRWSSDSSAVPDYTFSGGHGSAHARDPHQRTSIIKAGYQRNPEEEHLDAKLEEAKRNSRDMVRRVSLQDSPYAIAAPSALSKAQ
ncbi:hypothetical protein IAU60_002933 [Kwoniella sp. DSM 27419]